MEKIRTIYTTGLYWAGALIPSALQAFYSLIIAITLALYWSKEQLAHFLFPAGSHESAYTFHQIIKEFVDKYTNNDIIGTLSIAFVWAVMGAIILAIVYETVNIFVTLRNDKLIATQFTHANENKKALLHTFLIRTGLFAGLVLFAIVSFVFLFPLWHDLIVQPTGEFFRMANILQEIIGVGGLAVNIGLLWRWIIIAIPKF